MNQLQLPYVVKCVRAPGIGGGVPLCGPGEGTSLLYVCSLHEGCFYQLKFCLKCGRAPGRGGGVPLCGPVAPLQISCLLLSWRRRLVSKVRDKKKLFWLCFIFYFSKSCLYTCRFLAIIQGDTLVEVCTYVLYCTYVSSLCGLCR